MLYNAPFGRTHARAWSDSVVYLSFPEEFDIAAYALDGSLVRRIRLARPPESVTPDAIAAYRAAELDRATRHGEDAVRRSEALLDAVAFPQRLPVHGPMLTDREGNLWVADYTLPEGAVPTRWSVFDPDGRLLGPVNTPEGLRIMEIGEDYLLGVWRDEFDVDYVRLHRSRKPTR